MKFYTKKGYIKKLEGELNFCKDNVGYDTEMAYLDGYYDQKIETTQKQILPFVIKLGGKNDN